VLIQWAWSYCTYQRGARLITGSTDLPGWSSASGDTCEVEEARKEDGPSKIIALK